MKFYTINLMKFAVTILLLTILFRIGLSHFLRVELYNYVWPFSIIYGAAMFLSGWGFGKLDRKRLEIYDIGFRFHLTTYIVCNLVGEIWAIFDLTAPHEPKGSIHITAIFWGIGILIHLYYFVKTRKKAINGLKKSEIFE